MNAPTPDELRAAWESMRRRPCLSQWPADFDDVVCDDTRARLVAIEAIAARRRRPVLIGIDPARGPDRTAYWRPTATQHPDLIDRKRAAAGDRD